MYGEKFPLGRDDATGFAWISKAGGADTDGRFDFMEAYVGYLAGPPLHIHCYYDDTLYVLEGVLKVQANDDLYDLEPGDFISVPPGTPHTFSNLVKDQGRVRAINLMAPAGFDHFLAEFFELLPSKPSPERLAEVAAKYDTKFIGPSIPLA